MLSLPVWPLMNAIRLSRAHPGLINGPSTLMSFVPHSTKGTLPRPRVDLAPRPPGNSTRGLYPVLPTAPGAAAEGGNPVALATSACSGEKSTPAGTSMEVGSLDDERWTADVPAALASFGV